MKQKNTHSPKRNNPLPLLALAVVILAAAVVLLPKGSASKEAAPGPSLSTVSALPEVSAGEAGGLVIRAEDIGTEASYFDYDAGGTTVEVFAVQATDGTVRLALNTCQVCNGSPYAYFAQDGDTFVCQNCRNRFASTQVGLVSGGCNPVPITDSDYMEQDGIITVPASFLEDSAPLFRNWKNF